MKSRAQNNFRIGFGHDDRPNSFLLCHASFLAGQMYHYDELLFYITHMADKHIDKLAKSEIIIILTLL